MRVLLLRQLLTLEPGLTLLQSTSEAVHEQQYPHSAMPVVFWQR